MTSKAIAPEVSQSATVRMPLRTYSRRSLKRRHTSSPISDTERTIRRIKSLTETISQPAVTTQQSPAQLAANKGCKRLRFSALVEEAKSPNDLAWEALASSAPVLTQHVEKTADELHVADETEDRQMNTGNVTNDGPIGQDMFDPIVEEQVPQEDASEYEEAGEVSLEELGDDDGSSEFDQDVERDTTTLTTSSQGDGSYFSATPGSQKPRTRAPFLIFDKSPPQGFKVLRKRKASPIHQESARKRNRLSDGFSAEEARPSPFARRRRLHHLNSEVGSLELTQNAASSQQTRRSAIKHLDKKAHSQTNASLWHRRQYFGTSQFKMQSQDPLESFETKPGEAKDEDSVPTTVSSQGSADNEIDFIVSPQTDSPGPTEPEESATTAHEWHELREVTDRADNRLPPKRIMSPESEHSGGLTLRPDPLSWLRGVKRMSGMPQLSDAARRHS